MRGTIPAVVYQVRDCGQVSIQKHQLSRLRRRHDTALKGWLGGRAGGRATHLTLTLVQMIYSISSENGFWKVKELVRIQIQSLDLERNRYMTERTWPFSFTACNKANTPVYTLGGHRLIRRPRCTVLSSTLPGTVR